MWLTGLVAPWHVGSSQTRARTRVSCIGRQILNHCATREAPVYFFPCFCLLLFYLIYSPGAPAGLCIHFCLFLPPTLLPLCPARYTPSVPVALPSSPLSGTPGGCACFLLSLFLCSASHKLSSVSLPGPGRSEGHGSTFYPVPDFLCSASPLLPSLLPLIQGSCPYVALQSLEIRLFHLLLDFIHLLFSRLT